jgi:beta-glucosidase
MNPILEQETATIYLDPSQPIDMRVKDLISRFTLDEKISQMRNSAASIDRLGIPAYDYWNEGLHGVGRNGRATVFPQAIGMAATWDTDLIERVATAISTEARAKYHETLRSMGHTIIYQGLTFWSPNVNIFRDPRWGRGQETWGEDPILTGELGSAFVRGMQGNDPRYLRTAACAKHYAVHSGPEKDRHSFDAVVSKRDLFDTYLPAFKKLVMEAKVESVMGAYNRVYGVPVNASSYLLDDILRKRWGFKGHVISDCWALTDLHKGHHYTENIIESAAAALKAGCDLSCMCTYDHLGEAVQQGLVTEAEIDQALIRTYTTRFKLGMFDPAEMVPYSNIPMSVVECEQHHQLAYEAAAKSIVLLKNKNNTLPLGPKVRTLFVLGPNATNLDCLLGSYSGVSKTMITALEGIIGQAPEGVKVEYRAGLLLAHPNNNSFDWSFNAAASADVTIACMGLSPLLEGEEGDAILSFQNGDRREITLPKPQVEYIKKLAIAGAKVVLVLFSGSPVALDGLEDMVECILQVWYPGAEGGRAIADVLFGKVSPSGKLPITFPRSLSQLPAFEDYSMEKRTYRYSNEDPLYPFGFGLSYTSFKYTDLRLSQGELPSGQPVELSFTLTNTGKVESNEVVQIYLSDEKASVRVPIQKLVGFQRVQLKPGESQRIFFTITPEMMMLVDENGELQLEPGVFGVQVGGCLPGKRGLQLGAPEGLVSEFVVK